jgi:hypothetical protein
MTIPNAIAAAFDGYPEAARDVLMDVRTLVLEVAAETGVGPLTETLKWGQPAYLTEATRAGTTVRLGLDGGRPAVFVHCQTRLVGGFRADFPDAFGYVGSRALHLAPGFDREALKMCLARALSYHRAKRERVA